MASIPGPEHPAWAQVLTGKRVPEFQFLATKILMSRLTMMVKQDSNPSTLSTCIQDLRAFFEKNGSQPRALADLEAIVGKG